VPVAPVSSLAACEPQAGILPFAKFTVKLSIMIQVCACSAVASASDSDDSDVSDDRQSGPGECIFCIVLIFNLHVAAVQNLQNLEPKKVHIILSR
jgi:hypothetical protein